MKPVRACLYRARMMGDRLAKLLSCQIVPDRCKRRTIEGHMLYVTIHVNQATAPAKLCKGL